MTFEYISIDRHVISLFFLLATDGSSTSVPNMDALNREEFNRQLGLMGSGKAGAFLSTILEAEPSMSMSSLISPDDLQDNSDETAGEMITDVVVSAVNHRNILTHVNISPNNYHTIL